MSGIIYNDYIRPRKWIAHTDANANFSMRLIIFILGTFCSLSGFIVERFESIFQMVTTVAGMTTGAVFGAFTMGMLYPWANKQVQYTLVFNYLFWLILLIFDAFPMNNNEIGCSLWNDHKYGSFMLHYHELYET